MRLLALATISTVYVLFPGALPQASAAAVHPWCAHYMMKGGPHSCGFVTFEQCLANVSGVGGSCQPNPYYTAPPSRGRKVRHARH
jgi:hypothetical protein